MKRGQDDPVDDLNINKKRKFEDQTITIDSNKSFRPRFEDLPNEIIYEIFEYLDNYHIYQSFFHLNQRFDYFLIHSSYPIAINISNLSKSSFEAYHKDIILPNKHRIHTLHLSNPFTVDLIFSPPRFILKFLQLHTLILHQIKSKYLENIFNHLIFLPHFHSLTIHPIDYIRNPTRFYLQIFRLPHLKFCHMTYQTKDNHQSPLVLPAKNSHSSPIEHLIIHAQFSMDAFDYLLSYLPHLHHLSINCLIQPRFEHKDFSPMPIKHLKYVSLMTDVTCFNQLEMLMKYFFQSLEILHLSVKYDKGFLDAKRWEGLIVSSMPNLRIFDLNYDGTIMMSYVSNPLTFHQLTEQFTSSFWRDRQWFFTHQHTSPGMLNHGIFYSHEPYTRKDYQFYWQSDQQLCSHNPPTNLNSVQHVDIRNEQVTKNILHYFPNATELTIRHYFNQPDRSMPMILNQILPLIKLKKLVIESYSFPLEQLIPLLYSTPNLETLNIGSRPIYPSSLILIQITDAYQYVSQTNQIKNLDFDENCTLEYIAMLVELFPRLEYLKTGFNKKEIEPIARFIFRKMRNQIYHLRFLCVSYTPKIYLKKLKILIKLEKLLDDYVVDLVDYHLYIWL